MSDPSSVPNSSERASYDDAMRRLEIYYDDSRDFHERCREAHPLNGAYANRSWVDDARDVVIHLLDTEKAAKNSARSGLTHKTPAAIFPEH